MNRTLYILFFSGLVFLNVCITGCTRRDLNVLPDEGYLKIILDWGIYTKPTATGYYFYDNNNRPVYYEGSGEGFEGYIKAGRYKVVIFNTDPVGVEIEHNGNYDHDHFRVVTLNELNSNIECVDKIYAAGITELIIPANTETPVIKTVKPVSLVRRISYTVHTDGIEGIKSIQLFQEGAVTDKCITSKEPYTGNTACVIGNAVFNDKDKTYNAYITTLGFIAPCKLTAGVTFNDGHTGFTDPIDLSDEIASFPEEDKNIHLTLRLNDNSEIKVTVTIHGWKKGGSGGSLIE